MEDKLNQLRSQYPVFTYERFTVDPADEGIKIQFFYTMGDIAFTSTLHIPVQATTAQMAAIKPFVFNLGLVEMLSYWKTACCPRIYSKAGFLSDSQRRWWHELLINGLGEFFFTNDIDFTQNDFVTIDSIAGKPEPTYDKKHAQTTLIPIGGGKDSIVTLEQYKKHSLAHRCLALNPNPATTAVMSTAHEQDPIIVTRQLDPRLSQLNAQGYLNGHTPFSALIAFLSVLCCVLFDSNAVAVSNERSSNEGNVVYKGYTINHQYSKSFAFEQQFSQYLHQFLSPIIDYFSFMRPLGELQIARLFSADKRYFSVFKSCNVGRGSRWCGLCPKCASVYTLLAPFVDHKDMMQIFGTDIFGNKDLIGLFEQMLGNAGHKPFECIGTYEETWAALYLAWKAKKDANEPLPAVLQHFDAQLSSKEATLSTQAQHLLHSWNDEHALPPNRAALLQQELENI